MNLHNSKNIIIGPPGIHAAKKVIAEFNSNFLWGYLGENIIAANRIEKQLGKFGRRIELGEYLKKAAFELKQPYLDYIGKMSVQRDSLEWWASSISEKNYSVSKAFLNTCYLRICIDVINQGKCNNFVFFIENRALRKGLIENLKGKYDFKIIEPVSVRLMELAGKYADMILQKGFFLVSNFYRILVARYIYKLDKKFDVKRENVLIYTWITRHGTFGENGEYRDEYFGNLIKYIKSKGKDAVIVPYILGTVSYTEIIRNVSHSRENFLVPWAFLDFGDVAKVFLRMLLKFPRKIRYQLFQGLEISEIINHDMKADWRGKRVATDLLFLELVKRWKSAGIKIERFIYPYENQTWERVLCISLREFYPRARIVGYQHTTVPLMLLTYFFSSLESETSPMPDFVIVSGAYTRNLFINSGYNPSNVITGGAIRYDYLFERKFKTGKALRDKYTILVTPSSTMVETLELISKVLKAFEYRSEYAIIIKCHPTNPYSRFSKLLNIELPEHFAISEEPVSELLRKCDLLIYASSTTCIEAIALGVEILHVDSDYFIDLDPLDFKPELRENARNPEEIAEKVKMLEKNPRKDLEGRRKVLDELFGRVSDEVYALFLR